MSKPAHDNKDLGQAGINSYLSNMPSQPIRKSHTMHTPDRSDAFQETTTFKKVEPSSKLPPSANYGARKRMP